MEVVEEERLLRVVLILLVWGWAGGVLFLPRMRALFAPFHYYAFLCIQLFYFALYIILRCCILK